MIGRRKKMIVRAKKGIQNIIKRKRKQVEGGKKNVRKKQRGRKKEVVVVVEYIHFKEVPQQLKDE